MPRPDLQAKGPAVPGALLDAFAGRIADWQRSHGRSHLPWQNTRDPYRVWLSEVMLQQTQVSTVLGYFERFLSRFPDVRALAEGHEDEVLGLWSGLGYYSRARNMHRCAQQVVERFEGEFPRTAEALATLPGIGRSTAAAIAAFCFGERVAILDGNVKRVLSRVLAFEGDLSSSAQERVLWQMADQLMPPATDREGISAYTQGLMDLGATLCVPRKPQCLLCPVQDLCAGQRSGEPERFPIKTRKLRRSAESLWLLHATDADGRVWLHKRPPAGIWAGLYGMPVFTSHEALMAALPVATHAWAIDEPAILHVLTHRDLHLHPVRVAGIDATHEMPGQGRWFDRAAWQSLGLPAPMRGLLSSA